MVLPSPLDASPFDMFFSAGPQPFAEEVGVRSLRYVVPAGGGGAAAAAAAEEAAAEEAEARHRRRTAA
jgi:hypothetical protein